MFLSLVYAEIRQNSHLLRLIAVEYVYIYYVPYSSQNRLSSALKIHFSNGFK